MASLVSWQVNALFAREAAIVGTPAVSFFPREDLLSVDRKMVNDGWMLHSRDPDAIVEYVMGHTSRPFDPTRSQAVQQSVFELLDDLIDKLIGHAKA